jgi:hypothetical protein
LISPCIREASNGVWPAITKNGGRSNDFGAQHEPSDQLCRSL